MEIKTIQFSRVRKIAPELISRQFQYFSETVEAGAWADITNDEAETASPLLKEYVNEIVNSEVEQITAHYRSIAREIKVHYGEIEPAFYELMRSQNMTDDEISIAFDQFKRNIEAEMAKRSV